MAARYAGVVAPPLIAGAAIGLSGTEPTFLADAYLFTADLATLLHPLGVWKIGARLPFVNGVTFAGVAPMTAIAATHGPSDALPVILSAVLVAGLLGLLVAPVFGRAERFFPPVVTGSVITLIGISLLPVALGWAQGPRSDRARLRLRHQPRARRRHRRHLDGAPSKSGRTGQWTPSLPSAPHAI